MKQKRSLHKAALITAIAMVVVMNFHLSSRLLPDTNVSGSTSKTSIIPPKNIGQHQDLLSSLTPPPKRVLEKLSPSDLKLPTPIFVVGLPKAGTSSIHEMFQCHSIRSSHYCCCGSNRTHTHCNDGRLFSECMMENKKKNRPILEGCGDYHVYSQMDCEHRSGMFLPQHFELERLHQYSPKATFILNLRPASDWVGSVTNWYGLGSRFLETFGYPRRKHSELKDRNQILANIYDNHSQFIRDFVKAHPSHALVEVNITDSSAAHVLAKAFGLSEKCWDQHNKNRNKNQKKPNRPPPVIGSTLTVPPKQKKTK